MGWYTHLFQFVQTSLREYYKYLVPTNILFHDFFQTIRCDCLPSLTHYISFFGKTSILDLIEPFLTFFDTLRPFQSNSTNLGQGEIAKV